MMKIEYSEKQETIRNFLVESYDSLGRLDLDLVLLEKHPSNVTLLGNTLRTIHSIRSACELLAETNILTR